MGDGATDLLVFPIGFRAFHRRRFVNYQLNRAHALGFADADELEAAGRRIRSAKDCVATFTALSARSASEGRLRTATGYLRIAEFFTPPTSPEKVRAYRRYRDLFDSAFAAHEVVRHQVPYGGSELPAYRLRATGGCARGDVLVHGGFDSLIEEFYGIWQRIASAGFNVIAFDGPGQGGARALGGITFDHDWEKPVAAVLDHFEVGSADILGISMGGYWALRAASREPRLRRVISWPPVYDWLERVPAPLRPATRTMLRRRRLMTWSVRLRTRLVPTLRQVVEQALYISGGAEPMHAVEWFLGMNPGHLGSDRVTQDVLLLCGEGDTFQPPALARAQERALTSARSVCVRTFTAAEGAEQHCQMGNLDLACAEITTWLRSTTPAAR